MFRQFFAGMEWTGLALGAMALFLALFAAVLVRLFVLHTRRDYDADSRLPLDDAPPPRTEVKP
jgi:cbb3-type cytochrome oxidase subunit 3